MAQKSSAPLLAGSRPLCYNPPTQILLKEDKINNQNAVDAETEDQSRTIGYINQKSHSGFRNLFI